MITSLAQVALLVRDYDEAIAFYRDKLGFRLLEDTDRGQGRRWVVMQTPGGGGSRVLLSKAADEGQKTVVGKQAGGRVLFFLNTDDFEADFAALTAKGVTFVDGPRKEAYGTVGVFLDLYGNRIDLIEPRN